MLHQTPGRFRPALRANSGDSQMVTQTKQSPKTFEIIEIKLNSGGYDSFGSYYGVGLRLWIVWGYDDNNNEIFNEKVRASDKTKALAIAIEQDKNNIYK
jgi:hypothetical protein